MDLYVMSKDTVVAEYINNSLKILNKRLCPMYLLYNGDLTGWLETRAIDSHRANSRLLKKALRLRERDDISTVVFVNGATITDNYWVKERDSNLKYDDVVFNKDYFSKLALWGNYDSFNRASKLKDKRTPELTNTGSFEKCWKLRDGKWWMLKKANHSELFSELFVYELGVRLNFNMAEYKRGKGCIMTKDFTEGAKVNFEPAYSFMGDDEDYINVYSKLKSIAPELIPDYVRLLFMDTITANPDRHTFNFGLLRDIQTGEIISLAPNFDNNMALISRGYPKNVKRKNDRLTEDFKELINYDKDLVKYVPKLSREDIAYVINKINMRVRKELIIEFVMNSYSQIESAIKKIRNISKDF